MGKQLFFKFSDGGSYDQVIMSLEDAFETIKSESIDEKDEDPAYEYTLEPVWLTEEEYNNLPEADL